MKILEEGIFHVGHMEKKENHIYHGQRPTEERAVIGLGRMPLKMK